MTEEGYSYVSPADLANEVSVSAVDAVAEVIDRTDLSIAEFNILLAGVLEQSQVHLDDNPEHGYKESHDLLAAVHNYITYAIDRKENNNG